MINILDFFFLIICYNNVLPWYAKNENVKNLKVFFFFTIKCIKNVYVIMIERDRIENKREINTN